MKQSNSVTGGERMKEHCKLSAAEMEEEMERCPAPWKCVASCYSARVGCARKARGGDA
jgi:hypothetical protein